MYFRALITAATASTAIALALTGCSAGTNGTGTDPAATSASTASATPGPQLGQPFEVKQNDGTAKITIESATYGTSLGGVLDTPAKNGGYLILDVLWETSTGTSSPNPLYVKAKDASGHEGTIAIGVDNALASGDVPVGDKARGNVAFDIGAGPYTIVVTDQLFQEKARLTAVATAR